MNPVLIAGGGIGGLAAALGLARKGYRVVVLERQPEFGELGAGIQLAPNAFRALDKLGVGERVRTGAVYIDELRLMDGVSGQPIVRMELGERFSRRFANPYAVVHRHDLHGPLLSACRALDSVQLRSSSAVRGYEQNHTGVTVTLESGESLRGIALIGADGLRSVVRGQVVGDGAPRVSGHTIYRSVIPVERMPPELLWNAATLWAGPKCHVVHYPIAGWRYVNLAVTRDNGATEPVAGLPVRHGTVRREFARMCELPRRLISLGENWKAWVLCDRDPVSRWADGRVALLGDAAHPMLQYAAQGAAMALEDAVCLAELADGEPDLADVFERYTSARIARAGRVQLISRWLGDEVYHPAGQRAVERDALVGLDNDELYERLSWLYGEKVSAG